MRNVISIVILLAAVGSAGAQQVWRCGSSYGSQPCAEGAPVQASDPQDAAGAARAAAAAKVDARRADALEQARLAREKQAPKAVVMGPAQAASGKGSSKAGTGKGKGREPPSFKAAAPAKPGSEASKKARSSG
jgi:hypothetical protein